MRASLFCLLVFIVFASLALAEAVPDRAAGDIAQAETANAAQMQEELR